MNRNAEDDSKALSGIAQMLVALAVLAERACGRSRPLRWLILWILRPAEAVARDFVVGEALATGAGVPPLVPPLPASRAGDSVAGLRRLGACFRALALALRKLPAQAHRFARRLAARCALLRHLARLVFGMSHALAPEAPLSFDTS